MTNKTQYWVVQSDSDGLNLFEYSEVEEALDHARYLAYRNQYGGAVSLSLVEVAGFVRYFEYTDVMSEWEN